MIQVCKETEKCFQRLLSETDGKLPHGKGISEAIAECVLRSIKCSPIFKELHEHMYDSTVDENHIFELVKIILNTYSKVRLYHLGKDATKKLSEKNIRIKLNKLILLSHQ